MLRQISYRLIAALLISFCTVSVAEEAGESLSSLKKFANSTHLKPSEDILGMVGFYGNPDPPQWLILTNVAEKTGVLRESVFAKGKVVAERKFKVLPHQDLPRLPIPLKNLKVGSEDAFVVAEAAAVEKKTAFDSVHYQLRCREAGHEPVWMLSLINSSQVVVGVVYISANSGEVLRESWPTVKTEKFAPRLTGS
ncbi:MAG: hypothetical protein P1U58_02590 [Verrucomicrobiales bacterium]|nr:hypothetical protein [Verrucomicrobiales bacterium]